MFMYIVVKSLVPRDSRYQGSIKYEVSLKHEREAEREAGRERETVLKDVGQ